MPVIITIAVVIGVIGFILILVVSSLRIVRPTHRAVIETLGKYSRFQDQGWTLIIPGIQKLYSINVTEQMTDIEPQEIITKDNLNAKVDLVVYYKVKRDEISVKKTFYEVNDVDAQLETLARTTARNVIGTMPFREVNSERQVLNDRLFTILAQQTNNWGVEVLKVELKEIIPPRDVQDTMNAVIKAENQKTAALDIATAKETEADGFRRAKIKEAEGLKQYQILDAEGKAKAFELINKSFTGNAKVLKQLEVTENCLKNNSKIVLTEKGINPQLILGSIPIKDSS